MARGNTNYCSKSKGIPRSPLKPPKNDFYQLTPFTQVVCFQKSLVIQNSLELKTSCIVKCILKVAKKHLQHIPFAC